MRNLKFLMPMLAFVMAVGLAFATPEAQSVGWIDINGVPTELDNTPCNSGSNDCRVTFDDDELEREFTVYEDQTLLFPLKSTSNIPHRLPKMPEVD